MEILAGIAMILLVVVIAEKIDELWNNYQGDGNDQS